MIKEPESMKELHKIMEKLHKQRRRKSENEILREVRKRSELAKTKYGLNLHKLRKVG